MERRAVMGAEGQVANAGVKSLEKSNRQGIKLMQLKLEHKQRVSQQWLAVLQVWSWRSC